MRGTILPRKRGAAGIIGLGAPGTLPPRNLIKKLTGGQLPIPGYHHQEPANLCTKGFGGWAGSGAPASAGFCAGDVAPAAMNPFALNQWLAAAGQDLYPVAAPAPQHQSAAKVTYSFATAEENGDVVNQQTATVAE